MYLSSSTAITGEDSVSPYPCTILIPNELNVFSVSGSNAAPPATNNLNFEPRLSCTCLNNFPLISNPTFNNAFETFIPTFTVVPFPWSFIDFIIFLHIFSYKTGTDTINVISYSFIFSAMCLIPSQNAIDAPTDNGNKNPVVHSNV